MRRFFVPDTTFLADATFDLSPELFKHMGNVLRLKVGDEIELLDGCGTIAHCRLSSLSDKTGRVLVLATRKAPYPRLTIELIQGTAKGDKLDLVLQKGTELGANRFILSTMERSIGRLKEDRLTAKLDRWKKITQEAARQCKQTHLPAVDTASSLSEAIHKSQGQLKLMLWEEETQALPSVLPDRPPTSICILVGPEGGLTKKEADLAISAGFKSVRLGERILRTETAGLAIMSIMQYLYGDLSIDVVE